MDAVSQSGKGLRRFLDEEQQRAWLDGATLDDEEREASFDLEQRFKYSARLEKLLQLPQAEAVLDILRAYAATCLPMPCATERFYWSVSCLPTSPRQAAGPRQCRLDGALRAAPGRG